MSTRAKRRTFAAFFLVVAGYCGVGRLVDRSSPVAESQVAARVDGPRVAASPARPLPRRDESGFTGPDATIPVPPPIEMVMRPAAHRVGGPEVEVGDTIATTPPADSVTPARRARGMPLDAPPGFLVAGQDTLVEVVLRFRIGRAVDQILLGYGRDSIVFLDAAEFADLAEFRIDDVVPDSIVRGTISPGGIKYEFDTGRGIVRRGDSIWSLGPADAQWIDGRLFVEDRFLERVFSYESYVDWAAAQYHVIGSDHFPVVRRLERQTRRSLIGPGSVPGDIDPLPSVTPFADGGALDWSVSAPTRDPVQNSTLRFGLGSQLGGGSLDMRYSRVNSGAEGFDDFSASWLKVWPGRRAVRQVRLGDVGTTGRQSTPVTGAAVSNAPFLRRVEFADEVLAGEFPAGWEVEVYQGARLVGFDTVDVAGRFEISLPVRYGQNPVVLVGYGPNGEIVRTERTFEIPFQRLPSGQFEYGVSAGDCGTRRCQAATNVDTRYGITDRLTVQLGADYFWRDTLRNRFHPYALASVAATRSLAFTVEGVYGGLVRGRFDLAPTPDLRVSGTHTRFDNSDAAPLVGSLTEAHRTDVRAFWRPPLLDERVFFEGTASQAQLLNGATRLQATALATYRWSGARVTGGLFTDQFTFGNVPGQSESGVQSALNAVLMGPWPWARTTFVRAESRISREYGLSRFLVGAGRQILQPFRADLDVTWDRSFGTSVNLSLTTILRQVRAVSRNRYTPALGLSGMQDVEGSVLWNRTNNRPVLGNGRALGRAGVSGTVFLDANANGRFDPDEDGLGDVLVRVGTDVVVTDSLGRFDVWDLVPWEKTIIEVDSLSVSDPRLVATYPIGYVNPAPNSYLGVDLPFTVGWQLTGPVRYSDTGAEAAGITVLFERLDGVGDAADPVALDTTRVRTFADGTFYTFGLRHGRYRIRAADAQLVRLGAWMDDTELVLDSAVGGEDLERDHAVWLHRNPRWTLDGHVRFADGRGVPGVPVVMEHLTAPITRHTVTTTGGRVVMTPLPPGRYRMFVPADALAERQATADTISFDLAANPAVREANVQQTIVLHTGLSISGRVEYEDRAAADQVVVALLDPVTGRRVRQAVASDGIFTLSGVEQGDYEVRVAPGQFDFAVGVEGVAVRADSGVPILVVADPIVIHRRPWSLSGTVRFDDGAAVARVTVLGVEIGSGRIARADTDVDGRFRLADLGPGRYRVMVLPSHVRPLGAVTEIPVVDLDPVHQATLRSGVQIEIRRRPRPADDAVQRARMPDAPIPAARGVTSDVSQGGPGSIARGDTTPFVRRPAWRPPHLGSPVPARRREGLGASGGDR